MSTVLSIEVTGITCEKQHVLAKMLADEQAAVDRMTRAAPRWVDLTAISLNFGSPDSARTRSMAFRLPTAVLISISPLNGDLRRQDRVGEELTHDRVCGYLNWGSQKSP